VWRQRRVGIFDHAGNLTAIADGVN